jgi:hypothetical protein
MAKAIPTPHCAKVFCARKTLRVFLIGHKKPSFTAGTLYAIWAGKRLLQCIKKYTPKILDEIVIL